MKAPFLCFFIFFFLKLGDSTSRLLAFISFLVYASQYPTSSPYVVSVGATQGPESSTEEVACSSNTSGVITTGGGFSDYFERPWWEAAEVSAWSQTSEAMAAYPGYNLTGRGCVKSFVLLLLLLL